MKRLPASKLLRPLRAFPAVGLLGRRQIGKTNLAKAVATNANDLHPDLNSPDDLKKLTNAQGHLASKRGRLVVLDEARRTSRLFQVPHAVFREGIELREPTGQLPPPGSAPNELPRQMANELATL